MAEAVYERVEESSEHDRLLSGCHLSSATTVIYVVDGEGAQRRRFPHGVVRGMLQQHAPQHGGMIPATARLSMQHESRYPDRVDADRRRLRASSSHRWHPAHPRGAAGAGNTLRPEAGGAPEARDRARRLLAPAAHPHHGSCADTLPLDSVAARESACARRER
jgi:hypothetical protein